MVNIQQTTQTTQTTEVPMMSNFYIPGGCDTYNPKFGIGGVYNNRIFSEIFESAADFVEEYHKSGLNVPSSVVSDEYMTVLYYLLMSRFRNSVPKMNDENRFKGDLYATVFMYGPAWEAKLLIQKEFRDLIGSDELLHGATQINNHSFNPSTAPSNDTFAALSTVNDQTANRRQKPKIEAYSGLMGVLKNDVTDSFLNHFDKLFRNFLEPDGNLTYATTPEEEEILDI